MSNLKDVIRKSKKHLDGMDEPAEETPEDFRPVGLAAVIAKSKRSLAGSMDLQKGVHDAMYHHALHARAAEQARYMSSKDDGPTSPDRDKELKKHSMKHEFQLLRHSLENARKKSTYPGDMHHKMRSAADFYQGQVPYIDEDPELSKAKKHFKSGGGFVGHKDDKFSEE